LNHGGRHRSAPNDMEPHFLRIGPSGGVRSASPMLLKTVSSGKIEPKKLITHHFKLEAILDAYDTFGRAAETHALKVIIEV
jgi:threonine dehydrogenase-like Zn-dependent dehydrogenase